MDIAIPLYDGITALDAIGPYEVLSRLPGATVTFVADRRLDELPEPDVIVVPGGPATRLLLDEGPLLAWIRRAHVTSEWTTSVCTGSLLLGAAGVLDGLEATSHWSELETLRRFGATPVEQRVVEQGKVITAAGVSSGIDMALTLTSRIASDEVAMAIQLSIEYDPQPPFAAGSVSKAPAPIVDAVRERIAARAAAAAGPSAAVGR